MIELNVLLEAIKNFETRDHHLGTAAWCDLGRALLAYEMAGHIHGNVTMQVGEPCMESGCSAVTARRLLWHAVNDSFLLKEVRDLYGRPLSG